MFFTHAAFWSKLLIKGFDDNRFNVIRYASVGMRHYHKERSEVKASVSTLCVYCYLMFETYFKYYCCFLDLVVVLLTPFNVLFFVVVLTEDDFLSSLCFFSTISA